MTGEEITQRVKAHLAASSAPDPSTMSDEELIRHLPDEVLLQHIQQRTVPQQTVPPPNAFETPMARMAFQSGGQFLGGLTAGALATPETGGLGTIPAARAGGIAGGLTGDALRQMLAKLTGGGPKTATEAAQSLANAGLTSAIGEATLPVLGVVTKPIVGLGKAIRGAIFSNIPDPLLQWVKQRASEGVDILHPTLMKAGDDVLGAVSKIGTALKVFREQPDLVEAPSPKQLYPVAEKAVNAFEAVREQVVSAYGTAAEQAQAEPVRLSLVRAQRVLRNALKQEGLLLDRNTETLSLTGDEKLLQNVWGDFQRVSAAPTEGLPAAQSTGTFVGYQMARRLLNRMDEAIASAKARNTVRILADVRTQLVNGLKEADAGLAKQIPVYGQFVGLRDVFEKVFSNPDATVQTLLSASRATKQGLRNQLEHLNALAPPELKFMPDLASYEAKTQAAQLAKNAPQTLGRLVNSLTTPQGAEKLARNIFAQPATTLQELQALEDVTGVPFMADLKDMAARRAFQSWRPTMYSHWATDAMLGAAGFGGGGPIGSAVGFGTGVGLSMPQVQAMVLRHALNPPFAATGNRIAGLVGQAGQAVAPAVPPAIAALLNQGTR